MKKLFNSTLLTIIVASAFVSCKNDSFTTLKLTNNGAYTLTDKPVSIKRNSLTVSDTLKVFPVLIHGTDTIPSQLNDTNNDGDWDELFFVTNFTENQQKDIQLYWTNSQPKYKIRTSARFGKRSGIDVPVKPATQELLVANDLPKSLGYQRYQTDGPSWENDKVGFRHYLDGRNAKDLFGKKIANISPENVGINSEGAVEDNYHVMHDWGRDILAVGSSLGIGGYALVTNNELMRLGVTVNDSVNNVEKTIFNIQTEGPVKTVLTYNYKNWKPNNRTYAVKEKTTIWPGIFGYKNTVSVSGIQGDENLAVGIVNINNDKPLTIIDDNDEYTILYTHDKQTYDKGWWLGMALIVPKDKYINYIEAPKTGQLTNSFLAKLKIKDNETIDYYAISCWELSDVRFANKTYFENYLKDVTKQLSAVISIEIDK